MTPLRVCFIGDSLTLGVGDPRGQGWVGRLAAETRRGGLDITAYNLGIRRETSADIARRWEREVRPRLPEGQRRLIVFAFGTNDCLDEAGARRVALAETLDTAADILARARRIAPVLMVAPPPTADAGENARIAALAGELEALCGRIDIAFVPLFRPLVASDEWTRELAGGDGYHPGARGYARLAAIVGNSNAWRAAAFGQAITDAVSPPGHTTSYGV